MVHRRAVEAQERTYTRLLNSPIGKDRKLVGNLQVTAPLRAIVCRWSLQFIGMLEISLLNCVLHARRPLRLLMRNCRMAAKQW